MSTARSLLWAAGITAISVAALIIVKGLPTATNLEREVPVMFAVAYIIMRISGGKK